jgi:hypothetical protein
MTTQTIQAIDTLYRGCYFRSRLEARWAIVFDVLKIAWRYEPEAYRVGPDGLAYLPDFHLPDLGTWVEVKGDEADFATKADVYGAAVDPDSGLPGMANSMITTRGLLVLGPIPAVEPDSRRPVHTLIQHGMWRPEFTGLHRTWAGFTDDSRIAVVKASAETCTPTEFPGAEEVPYTATARCSGPFGSNKVALAYAMARAARFDQGKRSLLDSLMAASAGFRNDLLESDREPDTDEAWMRNGDFEWAGRPIDRDAIRQAVMRVRECAEARRAAQADKDEADAASQPASPC